MEFVGLFEIQSMHSSGESEEKQKKRSQATVEPGFPACTLQVFPL